MSSALSSPPPPNQASSPVLVASPLSATLFVLSSFAHTLYQKRPITISSLPRPLFLAMLASLVISLLGCYYAARRQAGEPDPANKQIIGLLGLVLIQTVTVFAGALFWHYNDALFSLITLPLVWLAYWRLAGKQ